MCLNPNVVTVLRLSLALLSENATIFQPENRASLVWGFPARWQDRESPLAMALPGKQTTLSQASGFMSV
jgi:hypothetical protein